MTSAVSRRHRQHALVPDCVTKHAVSAVTSQQGMVNTPILWITRYPSTTLPVFLDTHRLYRLRSQNRITAVYMSAMDDDARRGTLMNEIQHHTQHGAPPTMQQHTQQNTRTRRRVTDDIAIVRIIAIVLTVLGLLTTTACICAMFYLNRGEYNPLDVFVLLVAVVIGLVTPMLLLSALTSWIIVAVASWRRRRAARIAAVLSSMPPMPMYAATSAPISAAVPVPTSPLPPAHYPRVCNEPPMRADGRFTPLGHGANINMSTAPGTLFAETVTVPPTAVPTVLEHDPTPVHGVPASFPMHARDQPDTETAQ